MDPKTFRFTLMTMASTAVAVTGSFLIAGEPVIAANIAGWAGILLSIIALGHVLK